MWTLSLSHNVARNKIVSGERVTERKTLAQNRNKTFIGIVRNKRRIKENAFIRDTTKVKWEYAGHLAISKNPNTLMVQN